MEGAAISQIQPVSTIRVPVDDACTGQVVLGLHYSARAKTENRVEVALLIGGSETAPQARSPADGTLFFVFPHVAAGKKTMVIRHHAEPGEAIPLRAVTLAEVAEDVAPGVIDEIKGVLSWAASGYDVPRALPDSRLVVVALDGCTRRGVLANGGCPAVFEVPPSAVMGDLEFSMIVLAGDRDESPAIRVEARQDGAWRELASLACAKRSAWRTHRIDSARIPAHTDAVRFVTGDARVLVCIAEPVFTRRVGAQTRRNLIIVDLDTVRADRLGIYGYTPRPTSARLDSILAARGFSVFETAYAPSSWTLSSTAKFLSSRYLHDELRNNQSTIPTSVEMLAETLRRDGYYCAAFTGGAVLRTPGFEQGFHEYHWSRTLGKIEDSFPQARAWIASASAPFFLFLHTYEAHAPYTREIFTSSLPKGRIGPEGINLFGEGSGRGFTLTSEESLYVAALYDGGVRVACDATADLFGDLDRLGLWENSIVVVLSDHGEEFGEHFPAYASHGHSLYDELLRVPFAVYRPGTNGYGRFSEMVSLVDLVPTVLDLVEVAAKAPVDGESLVDVLDGRPLARRLPIMSNLANGAPWRCLCMYMDNLKYIETAATQGREVSMSFRGIHYPPGSELYRLDVDPHERRNLAPAEPTQIATLRDSLKASLGHALPPIPDGSRGKQVQSANDLAAQLRALGYVE